MSDDLAAFVQSLPKAELHLHIEGTLEPELLFESARRNEVEVPFGSVAEVRAAYEFTNLQSFLDIYYHGAAVLQTEEDFYDLTSAYLQRAHLDGVRRSEMFFDPQIHTERGIGFSTFMTGFERAMADAEAEWGLSSALIMCFLRHLSPEDADHTLDEALPFAGSILGVGLDSSEVGRPPEPFESVFARARSEGLRVTAHAGEEGPSAYVRGALDALGAERIDHGVTARGDPALMRRIIEEQIPLNMCPISNVKLHVIESLEDHPVRDFLDSGVRVTVNSDDPAYFGGYVGQNYVETAEALALTRQQVAALARNSIESSWLDTDEKVALLTELEDAAGAIQE